MTPASCHRRDLLKAMSAVAVSRSASPCGPVPPPHNRSNGPREPNCPSSKRRPTPAIATITSTTRNTGRPKADPAPGQRAVEDYRAFQKRIGTSRNVIVSRRPMAPTTACTLDAWRLRTERAGVGRRRHRHRRRTEAPHGQGARGIRFNLAQAGVTTPEMIEPLSKRVNDLGWHIQINSPAGRSRRSCRSSNGCRRRSSSIISRTSPSRRHHPSAVRQVRA